MTDTTKAEPQESTTEPNNNKYDGYFACHCGKIRIDVVQPASSNWVTPTAALCQCNDCVQHAKAVSRYRQEHCSSAAAADALTASNAVDMRQIYKSDAVKLTGTEYLQAVKLKQDSPAIRYHSNCCGTPLMMDYTMAPFFLVYQHTIASTQDDDSSTLLFQRMTPTVVLNHQYALPNSPPTPEGIPVRDGVSLGFMSHAIGRLVVGLLAGKSKSPIAAQLDTVPVSIGIDSIFGKSPAAKGEDNQLLED
ncbi:expressed unknown protein [Seminavis robusta]|uniref:CENP-V/GFA domain-containing protein n=1 Tax=Seminavis robusta TaxID=568900 RepID=A0A9N8E7G0_9STRA|nr:expressed unknown protein [Seminavis robusta]|eukprot:Sro748_g196690.1 n/a (249) ;mRNA; r:22442-23188